MDVDGDDGYSDDDLDALADDTFHRLEEHAITSTQQVAQGNHAFFPPHGWPHNKASMPLASGLERLPVGSGLGLQEDFDYPQQPSSDYGEMDDELLDGEIYDAAEEPGVNAIQASRAAHISYRESTQREHWRQQRYAIPPVQPESGPQRARTGPQLSNGTHASRAKTRAIDETLDNDSVPQPGSQADMTTLQAQLLEVCESKWSKSINYL